MCAHYQKYGTSVVNGQRWSYKCRVIDQAWGQNGWLLPAKFFFAFLFVSVNWNAKKKEANIPPSWPNKLGQRENFYLQDQRGNPERARCTWVTNQKAGFASSCQLADSAIKNFHHWYHVVSTEPFRSGSLNQVSTNPTLLDKIYWNPRLIWTIRWKVLVLLSWYFWVFKRIQRQRYVYLPSNRFKHSAVHDKTNLVVVLKLPARCYLEILQSTWWVRGLWKFSWYSHVRSVFRQGLPRRSLFSWNGSVWSAETGSKS